MQLSVRCTGVGLSRWCSCCQAYDCRASWCSPWYSPQLLAAVAVRPPLSEPLAEQAELMEAELMEAKLMG